MRVLQQTIPVSENLEGTNTNSVSRRRIGRAGPPVVTENNQPAVEKARAAGADQVVEGSGWHLTWGQRKLAFPPTRFSNSSSRVALIDGKMPEKPPRLLG